MLKIFKSKIEKFLRKTRTVKDVKKELKNLWKNLMLYWSKISQEISTNKTLNRRLMHGKAEVRQTNKRIKKHLKNEVKDADYEVVEDDSK